MRHLWCNVYRHRINSLIALTSAGGEDKGVDTFSQGTGPKVIVIARPEFEIVFQDVTIRHVSHYRKRYCRTDRDNIS